MRRKSAFRDVVLAIPFLPRIRFGQGARVELKLDISPDALTICAQDENHSQVRGTREYYDRTVPENPALVGAHLLEIVARLYREVPARNQKEDEVLVLPLGVTPEDMRGSWPVGGEHENHH